MATKHVIKVEDDQQVDRSYWQCDCGAAGSAVTDRVEIAAEKHVNEGDPVWWRHGGE